MLSATPFAGFGSGLQAQLATLQQTLDAALNSATLLKSLPYIGQQFGQIDQVAAFLGNAGNEIQTELSLDYSSTSTALQQALFTALGTVEKLVGAGSDGPNSASTYNDIHVTNFAEDTNGLVSADVELRLHEDLVVATGLIPQFTLGLPALPFKVLGTNGITTEIGFDYELAVDYIRNPAPGTLPFTFDTSKLLTDFSPTLPAHQLNFTVLAGFTGNASITADLGYLPATLVPISGDQNFLSANIAVDNVNVTSAPAISFSGSAFSNLAVTLSVSDGSGGVAFPTMTADFVMNWSNLNDPTSLTLGYNNVQLNIGQLISDLVTPVVADIQQYLQPLVQAFNVLNDQIPGLGTIIPGASVSSLAGGVGAVSGLGPLQDIESEATSIEFQISSSGISGLDDDMISLGSFQLTGSTVYNSPAALDPTIESNVFAPALSNLGLNPFASINSGSIYTTIANLGFGQSVTDCLDTLVQPVTGGANQSIDFPILDNFNSVISLLLGENSDLVSIDRGFDIPIVSPVLEGLSFLGFGVGLGSDTLYTSGGVKAGYDAYGLRELLAAEDTRPLTSTAIENDIADGFYILGPNNVSGNSGLGSSFTLGGKLDLSLGGFGVGISGGLIATTEPVSLSLNNGYPGFLNDGEIHLSELGQEIGHISVYNASGSITAGVDVTLFGADLFNVNAVTMWSSSEATNLSLDGMPIVSGIDPSQGPDAAGTSVSIYGLNLQNATSVQFQSFGPTADGTITVDTPTLIVVTAPQAPVVLANFDTLTDIVVTTNLGTSPVTAADEFTYLLPPEITGISPDDGSTTGGETVIISGNHLGEATGVIFGNIKGQIKGKSDNSITAYVPAGVFDQGSTKVDVTVTTPGGTSMPPPEGEPDPSAFTYIQAPIIEFISPVSGPTTGGNIMSIEGQYFGTDNGDTSYVTGVIVDNTFIPVSPNEVGYSIRGAQWTISMPAPKSLIAGTIQVEVVTSGGGGTSAPANYTYVGPPTITAIVSPQADQAGSMTSEAVAIYGTGFEDPMSATFGGVAATMIDPPVEINTSTGEWELEVSYKTVNAPGSVLVTVTTQDGGASSGSDAADLFQFVAAPMAASMTPSEGPTAGGTSVTISGSNLIFDNGDFNPLDPNPVLFGGVAAKSYTYNLQKSTITAVSPSGTGDVPVTVVTPGGQSIVATGDYVYVPRPVVSSISQNFGSVQGGTTVVITCSYLADASAVEFNGTDALSFTVNPDGTITAVSPKGTGGANITVTTAGGQSATTPADVFTYSFVPPVIDEILPGTGPESGGTTVTIFGSNLLGTSGVDFGGVPATSYVINSSGTSIEAVSPQGVAGTVAVTVSSPGEQSVDGSPNSNLFVYTPVPHISTMNPATGSVSGATTVTIMGTNLADAQAVDFGPLEGSIVYDSATEIIATSPVSAVGTVDVRVVGPDGNKSPIVPADSFGYFVPAPVVSGVSPAAGLQFSNTTVTITGSNLGGASAVKFGGVEAASYTVNPDGTITAVSPREAAGPVDVTVTTAGGTSAITPATDQFTFGLAPSLSLLYYTVSPLSGFAGEEIFGANLSGATAVYFGSTEVTLTGEQGQSADSLFVDVPSHVAGTVDVTVVTPDGTSPIVAQDQLTYTAAPVVESLGPTPFFSGGADGPVAGGTSVTIAGFGLADATGVNFGGTPAASLTLNSDGTITAISPPSGAGAVYVTVTSPEGTSAPAGYTDQFTYAAVPSVSGLSSVSGPFAGGNTVVIVGAGLTDAQAVYFGSNPATIDGNFVPGTYLSGDGYLTVTVPASTVGPVDVTVTTAGGTSATSSADQYTYMPLPVLSSLSASSGAAEGGTPVTITGTGLAGATAVDFGPNDPAAILSITACQIVVVSPASFIGSGTVDVTITTPNGTSAINEPVDEFTYTHAPWISRLTGPGATDGQPSNQPAGLVTGGTTISIAGSDLAGVTQVDFGDTPAAGFTYNSDGTITAVSPAGTVGSVDVTVTTPLGTSDTSVVDEFTYLAVPTITGVSPSLGSINGGTLVEITGVGLANAKQIVFGADYFPYTIVSDTDSEILVDSPEGIATGTVAVTVVTPFATSAISPADQFTYMPPPQISTISASSGTVYGGDSLTITGSGLSDAEVLFGGVQATIVNNTDGQIQIVTPEAVGDQPGMVDLSIETAYGTLTLPSYFTYALPPVVTGISESAGPVAGGIEVFVSGDNLFGNGLVPEVDFGGTAGTILGFLAGTSEQIGVMAPAGTPSTVDVTVTTGGGTSATSPADQFTYDAVPIVSGLDVFEGPSSGGTTVTIFGTGLSNAEAVDFGIDGFPATIVSDADNQLVVVSPQISPQFYPAATQDVIVQTPGGTSATSSADEFTYVAAPTVVDVDSDSGFTTGGDSITIYGTNLDTATAVNFGANAATIVSESADSIQVLTPAGTFGTVNVTVVNPGGTSATSSADLYSYQAPTPVVEGLSQSVGPTLGGTTVTITGEYFDDASEVDFGPYASTIVSDSSSQIVVSSPAGIDGTVDLTVTTPGGTSLDSTFDQFTGVPAPAVTGIGSAAEFGSVAGGTTVYIYGTDLENASAVDFGATAGTIVSDSATYLVATSPAGAAGPVAVTVATPYGTSATSLADQFTYIGSPQTMAHGYTIDQGTALTVSGPGVLAGDVDPQGIALTAELLGNPTYGSLAFGSDGSFIYTPENGYFGTDTFTYQADNGYTVSGPTTVSITVVENNPLATQVTNTADNGAGSLRQALQAAAADTSGEPYSIQFVMPLGSQTINLLSPLPAVSDPLWVSLDATQNVAINASPTSAWDNYNALTKSGDGTLTLTEAASFNGNIAVEGGQLQLNEPSTPTIALGVGATVTGDGTIELAGSVSDLTSAVNIANGSTATAGILVSGTNQVVGAITGNGNLAVAAGSDLTANSIVQNTLVIGAGSTLTIAPSGPGIQTDATAPSSTVETDADPAVVSDGSSDPITAIQAAIASGSISAVKGQQLENRIAMIKRLVATGTGLDLSLLESDVLAALPAPVTSTTTTAASEPPPLQVATIVPPVVDHALAADYRSVAGSLAPLALTPNNAATIMNNGTASSGARESLMTQLFQELAHDPSGAIAGYSISSPTEFSWKDTTVAGPAQMSQDASRTIFEALALDFADVQSNGSRHASGSGGRIDSDSMTRDWSDEFLYAVSAFGDSSTEAD